METISVNGTIAAGRNGLGGLEVTRNMHHSPSEVPVIVLTMHDDTEHLPTAFDNNASSFLMIRSSEARELFATISEVFTGQRQSSDIGGSFMPSSPTPTSEPGKSPLTPREKEISALVAQGLETAEIADHLCIAEVTVRTHYHNILQKLEMRNRVELTHYALSRGWTTLNGEPS